MPSQSKWRCSQSVAPEFLLGAVVSHAEPRRGRYLCIETFVGMERGELRAVPDGAVAVPEGCFLQVNGMTLVEAGPGRARARMEIGPRQLNQVGVAQGGLIGAFADAAAGWATLSVLDRDTRFSTVSFTVNLVRGVPTGSLLIADAEVVHAGRSTILVSVRVTEDSRGLVVATCSCSQLVVAPRSGGA